MKNDFQDTGMRQHRITVSGRWETREVLGLLQFPPCESSQAMVKAGTCRWSMPPWVQEIELRIQWGQREMAGRAAYNTREERDALRESLEDLQRVHLESSAEYWSLHPYEKIVNTREKNHPKALEGTVTVSNRQIRKCNSKDIGYSTQDDLASKVGKKLVVD